MAVLRDECLDGVGPKSHWPSLRPPEDGPGAAMWLARLGAYGLAAWLAWGVFRNPVDAS